MNIFNKITLSGLAIAGISCLQGYRENRTLQVESFTVRSDCAQLAAEPIKIAHLSDLQFPRLKLTEEQLLNPLKKERPDVIFISGDSIDRTETVASTRLRSLLPKLCGIAPVYLVPGNHETSSGQYEQWRQLVTAGQATLLENQATVFQKNNARLAVVGLFEKSTRLPETEYRRINPTLPTVIIAHHPEKIDSYLDHFSGTALLAVFSGHAHGGQFRIPGIGGVFSPDQGLFPTYSSGRYQFDTTSLFVSRGLANSTFPIRLNNPPHLLFVTIC